MCLHERHAFYVMPTRSAGWCGLCHRAPLTRWRLALPPQLLLPPSLPPPYPPETAASLLPPPLLPLNLLMMWTQWERRRRRACQCWLVLQRRWGRAPGLQRPLRWCQAAARAQFQLACVRRLRLRLPAGGSAGRARPAGVAAAAAGAGGLGG